MSWWFVATVTALTCTPAPVYSAWWLRLGVCGLRISPDLPKPVETLFYSGVWSSCRIQILFFPFWWTRRATPLSPVCRVARRPRIVPGKRTGWPGCGASEGGRESRSRPAEQRLLRCCDEAETLSRQRQRNVMECDTSLDFSVCKRWH